MTACNNETKTAAAHSETATAAKDDHQHSYRCPMNCEKGKTYDKPGECPVCGMTLEHFDEGQDNGLNYTMKFASSPASLKAGEAGSFSFTPKIIGKESEAVALDLQHEKKIHLIIVSDDLSYFEHIHPEYKASGDYTINVLGANGNYANGPGQYETRFEYGGNYFMFADYKPTGASHQVEKINFNVSGKPRAAQVFNSNKLSGKSGNYSVDLVPQGGKLITGTQMHIAGVVKKEGKEIDANSLEDYLGAKAHMVVISLDDKEYLHVHPDVADGKFDLHTTFKKPGIYRGWIQFLGDGKLHTIDFTLQVAVGSETEIKNAGEGHETESGHDHH